MTAAPTAQLTLDEVLTPCTQIAGTALENLWMVVFGLGLLAGSFYVVLETATAPFAPARGIQRAVDVQPSALPCLCLPATKSQGRTGRS